MSKKQYIIKIKFRTGNVMTVYSEDFSYRKPSRTPYFYIYFNGDKQMIKVISGQPDVFIEGETQFHNCEPTQNLFDIMPDDFDKTNDAINLIDDVYVYSKGLTQHEEESN